MKKIKGYLAAFGLLLIVKLITFLLLFSVFFTAIEFVMEIIQGKNTPEQIYKDLQIDNLSEFILIKGDEQNGYHLEFVEDADEKLKVATKNLEHTSGVEIISIDLLKKMIKAEAISQYPNLGGKITDPDNQFQGNVNLKRVTPNKKLGEFKNTASGEVTTQEIHSMDYENTNGSIIEGQQQYKIGIMAGYSTDSPGGRSPTPEKDESQLKEEELTIKVANYIQQLFSVYSNIQVVQIGSTIQNSNVPNEGRMQSAKNAGVDLLIGINFNTYGDGDKYNNKNGVEITYPKENVSKETEKLGDILKEKVSEAMNLNKGTDHKVTSVFEMEEYTFPALIINGGYLTSKKDYAVLSSETGLQKYAKGVVDGILEYYDIPNIGYGDLVSGMVSIASTIESNIFDLSYVSMDTLEKDIQNNDQKALKEFSLDEEKNLITASWSYDGANITISKSSTSLNYRNVIGKYTMPFEYMLFFYIDSGQADFVKNLADLAIDSEFVITIEDNITTTSTREHSQEQKDTYKEKEDGNWELTNSGKWKTTKDVTTITESVNSKLELTYADTWFVKFKTEFMEQSQIEATRGMNGKVTNSESSTETTTMDKHNYSVETQEDTTDNYQEVTQKVDTTTIKTISNQYEVGKKTVTGNEDKFVKIFNDPETGAKGLVKANWLFQILAKNPKTANMVDMTKYLLYKATGIDYGFMTYDFSQYENNDFNSINYGGTDISLTTSVLDKETFIQALQDYYSQTQNKNFYQNFLSRAGEIYDLGVKYNVNPELVVTMALKESRFESSGSNQNYWGWGTSNGSSLAYIGSFEEGVEKLAGTFRSYMVGGSKESMIENRYNERASADCNSNGYGHAGTLKGMLSVYSDLCGSDTKHREGNPGNGGNYYLKVIYGAQFDEKCGKVHKIGVDDYTVQEKADYTAYLYEQQLSYWQKIFGNYGTLAGGGTIIQEAINVHKYVRENGYTYAQAGVSLPNEKGRTIDCSSFVTWVLINAKVDGFTAGMYQWCSSDFVNNPMGWEEISVQDAQPGDILAYNGHVEIVAGGLDSARFLVYNCGGNSSIKAQGTSSLPEASTSGYSKSQVVKVLRVP